MLSLTLMMPAGPATGAPALEQAVKASYLFKFAPFVEWPAAGAPAAGRSFVICVAGDDPFGATLDDVVRGQKIGGRAVAVRRLGPSGSAADCQMLFAGASVDPAYAPFQAVLGKPVLTVTDATSNVPGGMIQFVMQAGRVRFRIDDGAARGSGLVISSKLLGLAMAVDRK